MSCRPGLKPFTAEPEAGRRPALSATSSRPLAALDLPTLGRGGSAAERAAETARRGSTALAAPLSLLDDPVTRAAVSAEHSPFTCAGAGRTALSRAIAGAAHGEGGAIELRPCGVVGPSDGSTPTQMSATDRVSASGGEATALGRGLATEVLAEGVAGLMGERAL